HVSRVVPGASGGASLKGHCENEQANKAAAEHDNLSKGQGSRLTSISVLRGDFMPVAAAQAADDGDVGRLRDEMHRRIAEEHIHSAMMIGVKLVGFDRV